MRSIRCACIATISAAEIKKTKGGIDYLSLEGVAGPDSARERVWITLFSGVDDVLEKIMPDCEVYAEGTMKIRRDSGGDAFLHINADKVVVLFAVTFDPKPRKKLKPPAGLQMAAPAPGNTSKTAGRPFDDPMPFAPEMR